MNIYTDALPAFNIYKLCTFSKSMDPKSALETSHSVLEFSTNFPKLSSLNEAHPGIVCLKELYAELRKRKRKGENWRVWL